MPSEPGWIFTTNYAPDPGQNRPADLYGEALFQQAERICELANKAGIEGVSRLFGPECWGAPEDQPVWWEPAEMLTLVRALTEALRKEGAAQEAVLEELSELQAILCDENTVDLRVRFFAAEAEFFG
jgi:hypothetical protein